MEKKPGRSIQEKNAQKRTRLDLDGLPEADIKSKLVTISAYGNGIYLFFVFENDFLDKNIILKT